MAQTPPQTLQPAQVTFTVGQLPPLESIRSVVSKHFSVKDLYLDPIGIPTVQVGREKQTREKFQALLSDLAPQHLIALLRDGGSVDTLVLRVFPKQEMKPSRKRINLTLFFVTVGTVFGGFYWFWLTSVPDIENVIDPSNIFAKAGIFTVGLLSIIGLHEFGHKAATNHHKLDATLPYFIPGPPPIGTFGALISLRSPPINRDQLFDLGLSGPAVGFVVTTIVTIASVLLAKSVSIDVWKQLLQNGNATSVACLPIIQNASNCEAPLLLIVANFAYSVFTPPGATGFSVPNIQLLFAAHIGALLTFLNIVPAWQLDGGHISRAVFGPRGHRIATLIGLVLLFGTGYWPFGFLLLVMMSLTRRGFAGVEPLDDVSPLSNSRKLLYIVAIAMLFLTFFPSPSAF